MGTYTIIVGLIGGTVILCSLVSLGIMAYLKAREWHAECKKYRYIREQKCEHNVPRDEIIIEGNIWYGDCEHCKKMVMLSVKGEWIDP